MTGTLKWLPPPLGMPVHTDGLKGSVHPVLLAGELLRLSLVLLAPAFLLPASPSLTASPAACGSCGLGRNVCDRWQCR